MEVDDTNIGWIVHDKSKANMPMAYSAMYKVCFTKTELHSWLKSRGWDFKGIASSLGISEVPGMASMQGGGDYEIIVIPFEIYPRGM